MNESDRLFKNRILELARRSFSRGCYVYSEFLTLAEQDMLCGMNFDSTCTPFYLKGGFGTAERKLACFGDERLCGYIEEPPIACILIEPVSHKFAYELSHRDYLGSLMALGLRRSVLGDIVLRENSAYLFCLKSVSSIIVEQLDRVKNTAVICTITEAPEIVNELPELSYTNVASERLDAIVAAVYRLSRSESQELIIQGRVYVDSRLTENVSFSPGHGSFISVRGFGRFIYEGVKKETRKGRLKVAVRVYRL